MTINVAVVTSEALVLGCDSIASTTRHLLDPFQLKPRDIGNGKLPVEFSYSELVPNVTGAWGNVIKMFPLQTRGACVAAVTAGLARLKGRTMSNLAAEFLDKQDARPQARVNVKAVANDFLDFIHKEYRDHYKGSTVPEAFWEGPEFLVGGYGRDDHLPSLYRVRVQEREAICEVPTTEFGVAWAGQADAVVRLIKGIDLPLKIKIENEVNKAIEEIYDSTSVVLSRILESVLGKIGGKLPAGVDARLPPMKDLKLSWQDATLHFTYQSWPTQDAIDFAAFLVNMQSARAKFVHGVATVGGRTHIGVIQKGKGFRMLNERELTHRNTGFHDDY